MNLYLSGWIALIALVCLNLSLGIIVASRKPGYVLNNCFLFLAVCMTLWSGLSIISDSTPSVALAEYTTWLAYGTSFLGIVAGYLFSLAIRGKIPQRKWLVWGGAGVAALAVLFSGPLVYDLHTQTEYSLGPLYGLYLFAMFSFLSLTFASLATRYRRTKGVERAQTRLILFGYTTMVLIALILNAVIPALSENTTITKIGPFSTVLYAACVAYAIVKHQLFDIRLFVARTAGYVLSVIVMGGLYSFIGFLLISRFLFPEGEVTYAQEVVLSLLAVGLAFGFQPLKNFFDKQTFKIFYRDSYDAQAVLDQLGSAIVGSIQPEHIGMGFLSVLDGVLHTDQALLLITSTKPTKAIVFRKKAGLTKESLRHVAQKLDKHTVFPLVVDDLEESQRQLKQTLQGAGIAFACRLQTHQEVMGYLLLGNRRSGSTFHSQDRQMLSIAVGELAVAIQNALRFEEIEEFTHTLQQKVDHATKELRTSNQKLKHLDEAKDEFISMASHQLRTPLTSIKGYISMVLDGDVGELNDQQRQLLTQAFTSSQRMVYLIADLLNVSRLRTGKFVLESTAVNLADIVEGEVQQLLETAAAHKQKLVYDKPASFPLLSIDENKVRQVIMNFLDNAIYYTPPDGMITVKLKATEHMVELTVTDTGIGVPKDVQHHLFGKFFRAGNARKARPDGTGLGLFMARKVIVAHGGTVIFKSKEGVGSTFGFAFSRHKLAAPDAQ